MRIGVYVFSVCPYPCQRKHNPESCIYRRFPETVFSIFLDKVSVMKLLLCFIHIFPASRGLSRRDKLKREERDLCRLPTSFLNLVPRSLVDEAEGEIWHGKKISFSWLAAPFDSCPIPFLKIDAVFRRKLSSNSSFNLEISAVGENVKPIRKDERRRDLEVICHSGLNNFSNMIVPLPKSRTRHPARAQALYLTHKTLQTPPPVRIFFCAYEVAQSPHEHGMSGANTRSEIWR